ncbi:NAD(P)-binding protein [Dothidotthia symphoricarpi CBS 119687]|uniref:3-dehydrosphinganine reductase n=1 Tax=Dothidotthia symphoricarpi CBS 119687 TaxID=1392245 RepID=A0A6A6AIH7_9PLEO|nr:NAD(P)-binding protein [Dothidotthia symphoricarpi CBS 119687]KAF2131759.1 NAD(P)-binding protein [Dothidotthia symphoricarpi CBS 119687]
MGKEIARLLSERGANLILVARTTKNLESAVTHAKAHAKNPSIQRFHYISADVTSEAENARILAEATTWNNNKMPEIVWACAGASVPGLFMDTSTDTLRKQMDLNYFAAAYLAHKTLQAWFYPSTPHTPQHQASTSGESPRHFIITSSAVAFVGLAGYVPYAPAKAALRSLADGLRSEVQLYNGARRCTKPSTTGPAPAPFDVDIHAIFPGTILSPGFDNEEKSKHPVTRELESSDPRQTELEAATSAVRGLENGNFMTATNWLVQVLRWGSMGSSQRDNLVLDTVMAWVTTVVWLFMVPDLNGKVWGWGKKEGMPKLRRNAQ